MSRRRKLAIVHALDRLTKHLTEIKLSLRVRPPIFEALIACAGCCLETPKKVIFQQHRPVADLGPLVDFDRLGAPAQFAVSRPST